MRKPRILSLRSLAMNKSELEFLTECAERVGMTLGELTAAGAKFWSFEDE